MLVRGDIHRSISKMSIDLHRAIAARDALTAGYRMGEYEVQFQFHFSGSIGMLPVETKVKMPFEFIFLADPGNQRNSQLDRPHARLATEISQGPSGLIPYAYVSQWLLDNDFNFVGAVVTLGAHAPQVAIEGAPPLTYAFQGVVHAAFQGYGVPLDADSNLGAGIDAGGDFTNMDIGVG